MKEKLSRLIVLLALGSFLGLSSGCGARQVLLTDADNDSTVKLAIGDRLFVSLASNPTTGYSWMVLEKEDILLELSSSPEYQSDSGAKGLVGSGGTETFKFKAVDVGETTLTLGYLRPWEDSVAPLATYSVHVVIEE